MDIKDKILKILQKAIEIEYARLEDDDGISGFIVSRQFVGMSALDRQRMIDEALGGGTLTQKEKRQVLMVAALTPDEYAAVGASIRVLKVKESAGSLEILLQGGPSDAEYVRGALKNQKGVQTTDPQPVHGDFGILMSFKAQGTKATPLTKENAVRVLKETPYIAIMPNA